MQLSPLPSEFQAALPVLSALNDHGYEAYFVGGAVRDALLHDRIHDVDIATSAYPAEVKSVFRRTVDTGIQHGTVTVLLDHDQYEVTTFRTESTYQDFRRPDHVTFVRSLKEDLKRRDFTVNALAMDQHGEITDLFAGLSDLQHHILRAVGKPEERFHEDALRMMRAVRFQSQLAFTLDPATEQAIAHHHGLLTKIAVERINMEFVKMMAAKDRRLGLKTFLDTQLFTACPGMDDQGAALATMLADKPQLLLQSGSVWLRVAAALTLPEKAVGRFMRAWKTTNTERRQVSQLLPILKKITVHHLTDWDLYTAGADLLTVLVPVAEQMGLTTAALATRYQQLPLHQARDLAISGRTITEWFPQVQGPQIGALLHLAAQAVVAGQVPNDAGAIRHFLEQHAEGVSL
jgi:tRNA nucleotidyltransferase (CCA-adding enzyme)